MTLTNAVIYLFYGFMITTLAGSMFSVVWLLLRRYLSDGNELLLLRCLRIGVQFYLIPVLFAVVLWGRGDNTLLWPWMNAEDAHVMLLRQSAGMAWLTIALMIMWAVGMTAALIQYVNNKIELKMVLECSEPETKKEVLECFERVRERLGIHKKTELLRSCEGSMPCMVGKIHRKIIVPQMMPEYSEKQMEIILSHELMHCKRHDLFYKTELLVMNVIHVVNPLAHLMRKLHKEYTEISCDLMTCEAMKGLFTHREYSEVLLEMAVGRQTMTDSPIMNMAERKSVLRKRVEAMLGFERGMKMKKGIAVLITALFVAGSSMTALAAGNGVVQLYGELYQVTTVTDTEEGDWGNELEEHVLSAEEFAAYGSIVMEDEFKLARGGGNIEWGMPANATYSTAAYRLEEGQVVSILFYTDPKDQEIEVGIENIEGGATCVIGTGTILHRFTVSKTAYYRVYVKNRSGSRITVYGTYAL